MGTTYEPGFKEQAVKFAYETTPSKAAQDLGVPLNTLYGWMRKARLHGEGAHVGSGNMRPASNSESTQYLKRISELEKAVQILKDALSFFVGSQRK
jgi:transposase